MKILIFSILFISAFNGFAQNTMLVLTNKTTHEEKVINEGNRIRVVNKEGIIFHGKLKITDTSNATGHAAIIIGKYKVNLNDIKAISKNSLSRNIVGTIILAGGGVNTGWRCQYNVLCFNAYKLYEWY